MTTRLPAFFLSWLKGFNNPNVFPSLSLLLTDELMALSSGQAKMMMMSMRENDDRCKEVQKDEKTGLRSENRSFTPSIAPNSFFPSLFIAP